MPREKERSRSTVLNSSLKNPRVREAFERALRGCRQTGALSFEFDDPWEVWRELLPEYRDRVKALARRADTLWLGDYRLDEFNEFYVALIMALITLCAAHDCLCFRWGQVRGTYPMESAVMVRMASQWVDALSALTGVTREKCQVILSDLTFSVTRSVDLHLHPLIPLDGANETLALAPPFPLHSRHDENILVHGPSAGVRLRRDGRRTRAHERPLRTRHRV